MDTEKARENRLRKRAEARGYSIHKSRAQQSVDNHGEYMVSDHQYNSVILGVRFDASLDEIEDFLKDKEPQRIRRWR